MLYVSVFPWHKIKVINHRHHCLSWNTAVCRKWHGYRICQKWILLLYYILYAKNFSKGGYVSSCYDAKYICHIKAL